MGFQANILNVVIASPSDVPTEREIVTDELLRWNAANGSSRRLLLQPVKWETHSSPQMGAHPQHIINERLLMDADIVVAVFGTRIGTATPDFISGTVEEIKRQVAAGKLAMLYFSRVPVDPTTIDQGQWAALQTFREACRSGGLYAEFASHEQLKTDFGHHLSLELNKPKYLWLALPDVEVTPAEPDLSAEERRLLLAATADRHGQIHTGTTMGGFYIQASDENFVEDSPRSAAQWKRVLKRLNELGYLEQVSESIYELTEEGYARADKDADSRPSAVALSFEGPPDHQSLVVSATRAIDMKQVDFLTLSEVQISSMLLDREISSDLKIPLDHPKIMELFNAPRACFINGFGLKLETSA
jgi:hypothetical protein